MKTSKWWVIVGILTCAILVFGAAGWGQPVSPPAPEMEEVLQLGVISGDTWSVLKGTVDFVYDFHDPEGDLYDIDLMIYGPAPYDTKATCVDVEFQAVDPPTGSWDAADWALANMLGITSVTYSETEEKWTITVNLDKTLGAGEPNPWGLNVGDPIWPAGQWDFYFEVRDQVAKDAEDINGPDDPTVIAHRWGYLNHPPDYAHYVYSFHSIQTAIDFASTGDTINVAPGTYVEQLGIDKNDLTLSGAGQGVTIIESPAILDTKFVTSWDNKPIVYVHNANDVTICHLTVDGAGHADANFAMRGIAYINAGGTVEDCEIRDQLAGLFAISKEGDARTIEIVGNTMTHYAYEGILVTGSDLVAIVSGNTTTGGGGPFEGPDIPQSGIKFAAGATGTVNGNVCSGHYYTGPEDWMAMGIQLKNTTGVIECSYNDVFGNDIGVVFADWDEQNGGGIFHHNAIYQNWDGMDFWNISAPYEVTDNVIRDNTVDGIWVDTAPEGSFVRYNSFSGNGGSAIVLENHTGAGLDAIGNWWGDASGPNVEGQGPGLGEDVAYNNTRVSPWWAENYLEDDHSTPWIWGAYGAFGSPGGTVIVNLQEAIDTVANGDTIMVFSMGQWGYYDGGIYINKDLTLLGVDAGDGWPAAIEGPRNWDEPWNALGIAIEAGHTVHIEGFEIRDASNAVAIVGNGENWTDVQVHECRFHDNEPFAVYNFAENWDPGNVFNATHNFWDHWTGPYHETENQLGQGDRVGNTVVFDPWFSDWNISTLTTRAWLPEVDWTVPLLPHVYVDQANGQDWYDGTCRASDPLFDGEAGIGPKRTLQPGIAIAAPGGTVHVAPGCYQADVARLSINRDVTLWGEWGEGEVRPIIEGNFDRFGMVPEAALTIDAGTVVIDGFTVRYGSPFGILARGNDWDRSPESQPDIQLKNNHIYQNGCGVGNWLGIWVDAEDNWWGYATGPYHPMENPSGEGNYVDDFVDVHPFRTDPFVATDNAIACHDFLDDGWNLVSVPLDPMAPAKSLDVFGDDVSDLEHRLYRYNPGTPGYDSGNALGVLPEYGFWLYLSNVVTIDVAGDDLTGADYPTVGFSDGWQQISTPFSTYWKNTMVNHFDGTDWSGWELLDDAVTTNGWIDNAIHQWDAEHQWYETISYGASGSPERAAWDLLYLKPWNGYWINNLSDGDLKFKFIYATPPAPTAYSTMAEEQAALWRPLSELSGVSRPPAPPMMPQAAAVAQNIAVMVAPNPVQQGRAVEFRVTGQMASFVSSVTVQVYTVGGQLVFDESTQGRSVTWNLTTLSGEPVANGLYLYVAQMEFIGGETAKFNKLLILK